MAQWLKALEDQAQRTLVQFPAPTWQVTTVSNPVPIKLAPSHRHTCKQNINAHKVNINHFLKKISWAVVAHAFNPNTQEAEVDGSLNSRLAWSIE